MVNDEWKIKSFFASKSRRVGLPTNSDYRNLNLIIMNIDRLKKKRQKNVQEQNTLKKHTIYNEAIFWKKNTVPNVLRKLLITKGINTDLGIFLNYEQDYPGISTDEGIVLTVDRKFFKFEMDLNTDRTKLVEFYSLKDITADIEIIKSKKGTGATWGWLALEVLDEINSA